MPDFLVSVVPARARRKSLLISIAWLIGAMCLALMALDGWRTWQGYENQLVQANEDTDNLARSLAENIESSIRAVDAVIVGTRQRLETGPLDAEQLGRVQATMATQLAHSPIAHAFFVYDATGSVMTTTVSEYDLHETVADRDFYTHWRARSEDQPFVGGPYRSKADGTWVLSVSRRLSNPDGSLRGIVLGSIALDALQKYYRTFDIGENGVLRLLRTDGRTIVRRPDAGGAAAESVVNADFKKDIAASAAGHYRRASVTDGISRVGSFRRVPDQPLVVLAALDLREVTANWRSEAWSHAGGVMLMILVIALLGLRLTARVAAESRMVDERLRRSEKMEMVGRLAAGVAHDFNNILQVIIGGMEVLRDETGLSAQGRSFLGEVENAAGRGSSLTHHLLAYSRKQVLSPQILDPSETLENLRMIFCRTMRSNIAVSLDVAPGTGLVRADPNLLQTALMNLSVNAEQAMPDGGLLRCEARTEEGAAFGELKSGRHVVITVADTGSGMSEEVMSQAFDPFFTTKGLAGTGLGLPMVQGFCRQSGGDVRILSTAEGTRVEIWLPEVAAAKVAARAADTPRARSGRVLLVDDSRDVRLLVEAFLRKGGFLVHTAANGYEALAAMADGDRFDLIITDYIMPGLDGLALIREARHFQPDLPALIISGYAEATEAINGLSGMAFLTKPFHRERLLTEVGALLGEDQRAGAKAA